VRKFRLGFIIVPTDEIYQPQAHFLPHGKLVGVRDQIAEFKLSHSNHMIAPHATGIGSASSAKLIISNQITLSV
jgi:hypothetical protein